MLGGCFGRQADLVHGKQLFEEACAKCHRPRKDGIQVGPDLAAKHLKRDDVLAALHNPSAKIDPKYINYIVRTVEGGTEDGLLVKDDAEGVVLRDNEGDRLIPRAQVASLRQSKVSLMPEGIDKELSAESLEDIAAYVESLGQ